MNQDQRMLQVELEITRGNAREKRRTVASPAFLIGASPDCDLVLAARQFPDVLAYLIIDSGSVTLRHLGLAPEMLLNGKPVSDAKLRDNDHLAAGPYEFVIHIARLDCRLDKNVPRTHISSASCFAGGDHETAASPMRAALELVDDIRVALIPARESMRRPA